ncbi:hypothetical protein F5Y04DRAFT_287317 [Hypomontagnella monticulosa]|nr:hypothetical protein F5Y04DRAFT_287317 [Hypomontagnella monticulosa]
MPVYDIENPPPSPSIADEPYDPPTGTKSEEALVQSDHDAVVDDRTGEVISSAELKLGHDDKEAIDTSNIIPERTRHANPTPGTYRELGEDELPLEELVIEDERDAGDVNAEVERDIETQTETEAEAEVEAEASTTNA